MQRSEESTQVVVSVTSPLASSVLPARGSGRRCGPIVKTTLRLRFAWRSIPIVSTRSRWLPLVATEKGRGLAGCRGGHEQHCQGRAEGRECARCPQPHRSKSRRSHRRVVTQKSNRRRSSAIVVSLSRCSMPRMPTASAPTTFSRRSSTKTQRLGGRRRSARRRARRSPAGACAGRRRRRSRSRRRCAAAPARRCRCPRSSRSARSGTPAARTASTAATIAASGPSPANRRVISSSGATPSSSPKRRSNSSSASSPFSSERSSARPCAVGPERLLDASRFEALGLAEGLEGDPDVGRQDAAEVDEQSLGLCGGGHGG